MGSPLPVLAPLRALPALALDAALLALAFGGFGPMTRDPRSLALLAIWFAGNVVLAIRRPARGQDVEAAAPDPLTMLVLLVVPLLVPAAGAFAARHAWATVPYANTASWIAIVLVASGLALRIAAMLALGARFSPLVAVQRGHALVTSGPYRSVRHPGYLGALLSCLGGALAFGSAAALPLVAVMLVAQLVRVRREEDVLARHFGAAWTAYAAGTGSLLPRPGRRAPPGAASSGTP